MSKKRYCYKACCVHGCSLKAINDEPRHFYCIPSKPYENERRQRWIEAIRRVKPDGDQWVPTKHSRVCSYHFVGGKVSNVMYHPAYVPTIFPTLGRKGGASAEVRLARHDRWRQRLAAKAQLSHAPVTNGVKAPAKRRGTAGECMVHSAKDTPTGPFVAPVLQQDSTEQKFVSVFRKEQPAQQNYSQSDVCPPQALAEASMDEHEPITIKTEVQCMPDLEFIVGDIDYAVPITAPVQRTDQSTQATPAPTTDQSAQATPSTRTVSSGRDRRTSWFAGYDTIKDLPDVMHDMCGLSPHAFQVLRMALPNSRLRLSDIALEDKLIMAFMKLKLGLAFSSLGALFAMHSTTAGRVFLGVLNALSEATRDWIAPPSERLPPSSVPEWLKRACPNCRYITHILEVRTEVPPTTEQRRAMSSKLVKNHTLKFLIAFAPNGDICFVSKGYGGRTTEAAVITESGFLDLVDAGDVVLSYDGFLRVDAAEDGTKLLTLMPAPTNGRAGSDEDSSYGYLQVREHVKRMIQRIRTYRIIENRLPATLIAHCDIICEVCCILVNLQPSLFRPMNTNGSCGS